MKLQLKFDDKELEKSYLVEHYDELKRVMLLVAVSVFMPVVLYLVYQTVTPQAGTLGTLRLWFGLTFFGCLVVAVWLLSLRDPWRRLASPWAGAIGLVVGVFCMRHVEINPDFSTRGFGMLMLLIVAAYGLVQDRMIWCATCGAAMSVVWLWGFSRLELVSGADYRYFVVLVVVANIAGMLIAFVRELKDRRIFQLSRDVAQAKKRSEELLEAMLPKSIVERLHLGVGEIADTYVDVTIIFCDLVGFSKLASGCSPKELVRILNTFFSAFDQVIAEHGGEKIKTIGDAYLVTVGCPTRRADHAVVAARLALKMRQTAKQLFASEQLPLDIRIGVNSGMVVAGVLGESKPTFDIWGDAVNVAARLESAAQPGSILVSESTWEQTRGQFIFGSRQSRELKGVGVVHSYPLDQAA